MICGCSGALSEYPKLYMMRHTSPTRNEWAQDYLIRTILFQSQHCHVSSCTIQRRQCVFSLFWSCLGIFGAWAYIKPQRFSFLSHNSHHHDFSIAELLQVASEVCHFSVAPHYGQGHIQHVFRLRTKGGEIIDLCGISAEYRSKILEEIERGEREVVEAEPFEAPSSHNADKFTSSDSNMSVILGDCVMLILTRSTQ